MNSKTSIANFIKKKNDSKFVFTPGPASLLEENLLDLEPCFGRNDKKFALKKKRVLNFLKKISGQKNIVSLQGSASLAIEIACHNFLNGKVLIINTGYYSERIHQMCKNNRFIKKLVKIDWKEIKKINSKFDWVVACYVETSIALKIPIEDLRKIKKKYKSKIFLDATASIGLEKNHKISDICCFSSCKGLLGLTGCSFITFNKIKFNKLKSFYFNIKSHINGNMTGPYHTILSLSQVIKKYKTFKSRIKENKKIFEKKFKNNLIYEKKYQPILCTNINKKIFSKNKNTILYKPRSKIKGSIICHLGGVHLKTKEQKELLNLLNIK